MRRMAGLIAGILLFTPIVATAEELTAVTYDTWFVELGSAPAVAGTSLTTLNQEKAAFRSAAKKSKLAYTELYSYSHLWNGLAVRLDPGDLGKLSRLAGVKALYPVVEVWADLGTAVSQTGADIVQSSLGYTGDGVRVGVIDTGIDYHHPDLGGCFGEGCRVEVGWDFVGNAFSGSSSTPVPDADPDDCGGHGTHVAGIVGADGTVVGVAPGVTFGAYRVFGCSGSTTTAIMAAAMEQAYLDGMDVVNMSIGSSTQWPQYPSAVAATNLVNAGVVVVASIGNAGIDPTQAGGLWAAGAPGVGTKVIGTASFDNTFSRTTAFDLYGTKIPFLTASSSPAPAPISGTSTVVPTGTPSTTNDACNAVAPAPGSLTGVWALIRRGTCGFYEKAYNAQLAGAVGVIIYNNVAGAAVNPNVAGTPAVVIPVISITSTDGAAVYNATDPTTIGWGYTISTPLSTAGLISSFSSYGPTPTLDVKPDIGAPGGSIWSTYPVEKGSYANLSGTSMASPHVAGAAALFLEAHPNTPSQTMDVWLQNSADPHLWSGNSGLGILDHVHRQGAGMLDIDDAILATVKIEPSDLALGEGEFGPVTKSLLISNEGGLDVTFDLSWESALATYGDILPITPYESTEDVAFTDCVDPISSVLVPAGGSATICVTVTPGADEAGGYGTYGGYLYFDPQGGGQSYSVPYMGIEGDYQEIQVLLTGGTILSNRVNPADYATDSLFTMSGTDKPRFFVHLRHQVRRLRFEVKSTSGKSWHRAFPDFEYVGRSSATNTLYTFDWDAVTTAGKKLYTLPDGTYTAKISILKANGDDANPAHWESWTSGVFTIDRP